MAETKTFRAGVFSVVKHCYLPRAVSAHPRFELVVVTDDADQPDWVHERNQKFADEFGIPYVPDVAKHFTSLLKAAERRRVGMALRTHR